MSFRRLVFRIAAFALIMITLCVLSVYFIYAGNLSPFWRVFLYTVVAALAVSLVLAYAALENKLIIKPLKRMQNSLGSISEIKGGEDKPAKLPFDNDIRQTTLSVSGANEEFFKLEQIRKTFVANASHELRSPLTSIQGFAQAMLDGTIDIKDRDKYLEIVFDEAKRLTGIVNSLLDLSRMDSGQTKNIFSDFDISSLICEVLKQFEPNLAAKKLKANTLFEPECPAVRADKDKIRRVLINLIDNAIKYTHTGTEVFISAKPENGKITVSVEDRGIGISKKDQMLIFERFYMVDKARTPSKERGTGLGLSIVKKIIDDHGQAVWVESEKSEGAKFMFTLAAAEKRIGDRN